MASSDDIVFRAAEGSLHRYIVDNYEKRGDGADTALVVLAVQLHNEGKINLLTSVNPPALAELQGFPFFTLQQFYCKAIPGLEVDPLQLMAAVDALVEAGGQDLASFEPNGAFRDWCATSRDRVNAVLGVIETNVAQARSYLSLTLEAGARLDPATYLAKSIAYVGNEPELQLGALTAMARIDSSGSPELAREALDVIASLLTEEADDTTRTHVLIAAINLYVHSAGVLHDRALEVMREALSQGGDGVLDRGANALYHHRNDLSDAMIELMLTSLEGVKPANKRTISILDGALSRLLSGHRGTRVSNLLEHLLLAHPDALELKEFKSVSNELLMNHPALRDDMVVRWLMSGHPTLADAISHLVGAVGGAPVTFNIDLTSHRLNDEQAVFLARKAVGWFFFHPITAASFVICLLRTVKGEVAEQIGDLLFEPLLLNFSGELKDYLEQRLSGPRDKAKAQIRRALRKLEDYIGDLRSTGLIAELEPSERDRMIGSPI